METRHPTLEGKLAGALPDRVTADFVLKEKHI